MRCFKEFTINGITRLTLISGVNGVGKSTLLESLLLLIDHKSPDVFAKLNSFRGNLFLSNTIQRLWEPLFSEMDTTNELVIAAQDHNETKTFRLQKNKTVTMVQTENYQDINNDIQKKFPPFFSNHYQLNFTYHHGDYEEKGCYFAGNGSMTIQFDSPPRQDRFYVYPISSHVMVLPNLISEWFGKIELSGKKKILIDVLRVLNPNIKDLFTVIVDGVGYIYVIDITDKKLPLREMGDGINKLLLISLTMIANPECIVLIDEVENGFHYSFHADFWKLMDKLTAETDCQILATTHSYECIRGAVNGVTENGNNTSLGFIRLEEEKGKIIPHIFTKEMLEFAVNSQMEVR
jgi:AAA15 family ATPase/GTPase